MVREAHRRCKFVPPSSRASGSHGGDDSGRGSRGERVPCFDFSCRSKNIYRKHCFELVLVRSFGGDQWRACWGGRGGGKGGGDETLYGVCFMLRAKAMAIVYLFLGRVQDASTIHRVSPEAGLMRHWLSNSDDSNDDNKKQQARQSPPS